MIPQRVFKKINALCHLRPYKNIWSKILAIYSYIKQVKFLGDLDPHWYFGRVVAPNYETKLMGSLEPPQVGLGVLSFVNPLRSQEKQDILYIFPVGSVADSVMVKRGPQDLPLLLSTEVIIGPQNPLHSILTLCNSKALEGDVHSFFENLL